MHITIRHGSEIILQKTLDQAEKKVQKLARIIDERNYEAQAHIDILKESGSQNSESMWRATLNIDMAGDRYTASEVSSTPEKAIERSIKEMKDIIRNAKSRHMTMVKRGGGMFKSLSQRFF
jgi:ribosome-associated translation inhibitor RaiA